MVKVTWKINKNYVIASAAWQSGRMQSEPAKCLCTATRLPRRPNAPALPLLAMTFFIFPTPAVFSPHHFTTITFS
jgi:hypothetical protein